MSEELLTVTRYIAMTRANSFCHETCIPTREEDTNQTKHYPSVYNITPSIFMTSCHGCMYFLITFLLRYDLPTIQFTHLK